jgi:TPR repeat protein
MTPARFLALVLCALLSAPSVASSAAWELLERAESLSSGSAGRVDEREACSLFEQAEATGDPVARLRVAILRQLGLCGFPADPARAAGLAAPVLDTVRRLAESEDPAAQTALATALLLGVGVPADPAASLPWYQKAAERGQTPAMNSLGWMYGAGVGVPADLAQSFAWYTRAAERGHAGAMLETGLAHLRGRGTPEDAAAGANWIRRAAERRHPRAMAELAHLLVTGPGRNIPEALSWLGRAVALGHSEAAEALLARISRQEIPRKDVQEVHRELARIYENGWHGVPKDVERARVLYRRAAELGDEESIGWLKYEKLLGRE